jgi:predicted nucleotidyltransferase
MRLSEDISRHRQQFADLCQKHKVKYLYAFGSSITEKFDVDKSDIDLVVEVDEDDPVKKGNYLISLWDNFELFFHRRVDLLTESSIKNPYLKNSIDSTKILIYDGTRSKIFV